MTHRILRLAPVLLLAACATLSQEDCQRGDWQAIGAADGAKGRTPAYLGEHAKACSKYGITPDARRWEAGRQQGLPVYCTPQKAYEEGSHGRPLSPVCPTADARAMAEAHQMGLTWYRIGREIDDLERDRADIRRELATLPKDSPRRSHLFFRQMRLQSEIFDLERERRAYRYPPGGFPKS